MSIVGRYSRLIAVAKKLRPITNSVSVRKIHRWVHPTLVELKKREEKQGGKLTFPRNTFAEWNLEAEIYAFGMRLHEEFDQDLLLQAFTDRSYVIQEELRQKEIGFDFQMKDNRELVEDGQQLMKDYVQAYLEHVLPRFPLEGIAAVKDHLLSEEHLAHLSEHLGTKDIILASEHPPTQEVKARVFSAVVGALLRSSGHETAELFVRDFVITQLQGQDVNELWPIDDPWSMLRGVVAKDGGEVEARLIGEAGSNTLLACYRVGLYRDRNMLASGFGETVTTARDMAAREALKKVFGTEDHAPPIDFKLSPAAFSTRLRSAHAE